MRRALGFSAALLLGMFLLAPVHADDTKWVRGTVTAMSGDSITVKVKGSDMTFTVDKDTKVIAKGAGTKTEMAKEEGKAGVPLSDIVKVGGAVEVHYHDMGDMKHAAEVRSIPSAGEGASSEDKPMMPKAMTADGTVSAVADDSITIKSGDQEWTFTVDEKTKVIGTGAGTMAREMKAKGEKTTLTSFVSTGGMVTVTYHDMGATKHAAEIKVTRKGPAS